VITFIVFIALIVSIVSVVSSVNKGSLIQLSSSDGLVAYYKFENNSLDSSGNELNGWPVGILYSSGVKNQSAVFDGDGDRVAIADNNLLDLQEFTLSGWFYFQDDINSSRLITKEFNGDWSYRLLTLDNGAFGFNDALFIQVNKMGGGILQVQVNNALQNYTNQWVFLSSTYDGNVLKLYLNSTMIGNVSGSTAIKNTTVGLGIGADVGGNFSFKGKIDEVKIYNKALNSSELLKIM